MDIIREILVLIQKDERDACKELSQYIKPGDEMYGQFNDFKRRLLNKPYNFQKEEFRKDLDFFVDHHKDHIRAVYNDQTQNAQEGLSSVKDRVYDLLCGLNFTRQKKGFDAALNSNKSLIPFVIKGDGNYGQEWLYNRLIHQFADKNLVHQTIVLDFSSSGGIENTEDVLDLLANKLKCEDYDINNKPFDKKFVLIDVIREKIKSGTQFIVFKNAHNFLKSEHFSDLYGFMEHLSTQLDTWNKKPTSENHQCICFFVDDKAHEYSIRYCLSAQNEEDLLSVRMHTGLKFIVLCPIQPIQSSDLNQWLAGLKEGFDMFQCILTKYQSLDNFLNQCSSSNPVDLIKQICEEIDKDYEKCKGQWLTHI
jgi:hypothetical protein